MGKKITEQNNFYYLTLALVILLLCSSFEQVLTTGFLDFLLQGVTVFTFIVCLLSLKFDQKWFRFLLVLAICWAVVSVIQRVLGIKEADIVALTLMFTFYLGTFLSIVRQILMTGSIDSNKVVGSLALFLLLGLMWAIAYLMILEFSAEAFTGMTQLPWADNYGKATYFSFVTLTTLGYGDISPISPVAQVIVYLEAIAGVFYMAIVVASLVGASQSNQEKSDG
ncbi:potassium channel family protein [Photobacterium sp. SDRW27]|uniref:potassium channel family protein n=1 Tax=Photobacterium obscurum TaxID=2829490 RepID=UPI0022437AD9|nr:potassium channel family protein [Photobacterium obscurum]MCW8327822.1 potassium channel family protein [Photobacterium obscurum]